MTDSVELSFCDLCGVSIPKRDLDSGLAKTVDDKVLGACCLAKLMEAGPPSFKKSTGAREPGAESAGTGMLIMTAVMLIALIAGFYLVDSRAQAREQVFGKSVRKIQGALISVEDTLGRVHGITKALPLEGIETKIGGIPTELSLVRPEIEPIKTRPGSKFVSGMS